MCPYATKLSIDHKFAHYALNAHKSCARSDHRLRRCTAYCNSQSTAGEPFVLQRRRIKSSVGCNSGGGNNLLASAAMCRLLTVIAAGYLLAISIFRSFTLRSIVCAAIRYAQFILSRRVF